MAVVQAEHNRASFAQSPIRIVSSSEGSSQWWPYTSSDGEPMSLATGRELGL